MQYESISIRPNIKPLPDQELVFNSKAKLNNVPSTRRAGKTGGISYYSLIFGCQRKKIAICYPTHADSLETFNKIESAALPLIKKGGINRSHLIINLKTGGQIRFFSYESFARVRGKKFHYVFLDEFQECRIDESMFWAALLPTLADYKGQAFFFGTPKKGTLIHKFSLMTGPEWAHYKMTAENNPFIDPEEIKLQKKILNPLVFAQEWQGQFVDFSGDLWMYDLNTELHYFDEIEYDRNHRLTLTFDFNVDPGTCLVMQKIDDHVDNGGGINFINEFTKKGGTEAVCQEVLKYLISINFDGILYVTGDTSGNKRDTRGNRTDYDIIKYELGKYYVVRFINTQKINANLGYSRDICNTALRCNLVYIDSKNCPILANDLLIAKPKEGTDEPIKDRGMNKLDSFDAFRYGIISQLKTIKEIINYNLIVNPQV